VQRKGNLNEPKRARVVDFCRVRVRVRIVLRDAPSRLGRRGPFAVLVNFDRPAWLPRGESESGCTSVYVSVYSASNDFDAHGTLSCVVV
jgi:hypothetical protein